MRKKPITRDQVRVHHYEVWTLPYGSFHGRHHRDRAKALRPIERLWKPLLDQLHRQEREWWNSGPATKPELWGEFEFMRQGGLSKRIIRLPPLRPSVLPRLSAPE